MVSFSASYLLTLCFRCRLKQEKAPFEVFMPQTALKQIALKINGRDHKFDVDPETPLL